MGFGYIKHSNQKLTDRRKAKILNRHYFDLTIEIHKPKPSLLKSTASLADYKTP